MDNTTNNQQKALMTLEDLKIFSKDRGQSVPVSRIKSILRHNEYVQSFVPTPDDMPGGESSLLHIGMVFNSFSFHLGSYRVSPPDPLLSFLSGPDLIRLSSLIGDDWHLLVIGFSEFEFFPAGCDPVISHYPNQIYII